MQKTCPVFNKSLKFSKSFYGVLAIIAFLIHNYWIIGVISLMMIIEIFSIKLSLPYQFHKKFLVKKGEESIQKEQGELSFVCGLAGIPLFIAFLLIYFGKLVSFSWIVVLLFAGLLLLSGVVGLCVATLMYVLFKKIFNK